MLNKIHSSIVKSLTETFNNYAINCDAKFNPEIDLVKEYMRSIRYQDVIENKIQNYFDDDLSKGVLFYNYSAPRKEGTNVKTFQIYFNKKNVEIVRIDEIKDKNKITNKYHSIDDEVRNDPDVRIRDLFFGVIDYDFTFVTSNLDLMLYFQSFYGAKFSKNVVPFNIKINIPEYEEIEFDVRLSKFSDLENFSFIDLENFGALYQVSFSLEIEVPIISDYYAESSFIKDVIVELKI